MSALSIQIPVELPSAERLEQIFREECAKRAGELAMWLDAKQAAAYLRMSLRTFWRKKKKLGLPTSEIDGIEIYWRADLDALGLNHIVRSATPTTIKFPSIEAQAELVKRSVA